MHQQQHPQQNQISFSSVTTTAKAITMQDILEMKATRKDRSLQRYVEKVREAVLLYASTDIPQIYFDVTGTEILLPIYPSECELIQELRAQLKDIFPDLAVTVNIQIKRSWWICGRPSYFFQVTIVWK